MTLALTDEERDILRRALKTCQSDLRVEMTRSDAPEFSARLKHQEQLVQRLLERLDSRSPRRPTQRVRAAGRGAKGKRRR